MKKLNKKGVSLAELLAVVVIMGIIAAIAIPLVGNVIETSKKKAFLGDLVTVAEAARTYCLVEGKDTEGFCVKYPIGVVAAGNIQVSEKGVVTVHVDNKAAIALNNIDSDENELAKYLSKTMTSIGKDVNILTDGSKYYVRVSDDAIGDYVTAPVAVQTGNVAADASVFTAINFIDPTNENALDNITKVVADPEEN